MLPAERWCILLTGTRKGSDYEYRNFYGGYSFSRWMSTMDIYKIQFTFGKIFLLATGLIAIGVAIMPIGTDPWRRSWLSSISIISGLIILTSAFKYPYRAKLPFSDAFLVLALFLVGFLASGAIDYSFAGGDAFHSYRGFPFRWLIGSLNPDMSKVYKWSLFWPGLLVDGFFWFIAALGTTLFFRQLRNLLINRVR